MEPQVLLAQLRALFERAPDFEKYLATSKDHMIWLGQAHALISRWDSFEAIAFRSASDLLTMDSVRAMSVAKIFNIIQRAISDLELKIPVGIQTVFGAGDVYDIFKSLNDVIASAEKSIFIIDPYLDETIFSHYLNSRKNEVCVRLLTSKNSAQLKITSEKYSSQYGQVIEVKRTNAIHDRIIFIDGYVCWILGQSLKDAAKAKPTYLAPLSPDVIPAKLADYYRIWMNADVL